MDHISRREVTGFFNIIFFIKVAPLDRSNGELQQGRSVVVVFYFKFHLLSWEYSSLSRDARF